MFVQYVGLVDRVIHISESIYQHVPLKVCFIVRHMGLNPFHGSMWEILAGAFQYSSSIGFLQDLCPFDGRFPIHQVNSK